MNADAFNMSIRVFLIKVGVHSQREIEAAVDRAIAAGKLQGNETLPAKMVLTLAGTDLRYFVTACAGSAMIFMMICCADEPVCGGSPASIS